MWAKKDEHAWSIPKGELDADEDPLRAALRELAEETGWTVEGAAQRLTPRKQASGKLVYAWAVEADFDPGTLRSNTFTMEWPPKSGRKQAFPEVDRGEWFGLEAARTKMHRGQEGFLDELMTLLSASQP